MIASDLSTEPEMGLPDGCALVDTALTIGGREWRISAVGDQAPLVERVREDADLAAFPYGLLLWPSAIALAERLAQEPARLRGRRILELGAGAGLPGMVAHAAGAHVTQTDYQTAALALARANADQNGVTGIEYLLADWRSFPVRETFDMVIGSDVLYEISLHDALIRLLSAVLAPKGVLLLSDPLRPHAMDFADRLDRAGWRIDVESHAVPWEGKNKEIALFTGRCPQKG